MPVSTITVRHFTWVVFGAALACLGAACSLENREGPEVTCAELECGRINACQEGIIAQCVDGRNVRYHVCGTDTACEQGWQTPGQFRCSADLTDCEGCRPEREEGCGFFGQGGESPQGSSTGAMGGGGIGAGGTGGGGMGGGG